MPDITTTDVNKIDAEAVDGLLGANNSMAYKIHEIEKHFHNSEDWFGVADTPSATHFADDISAHTLATPVDPFQITAGNDVWGAWVQVLGSGDTPNRTVAKGFANDMVKFDPQKILIAGAGATDVHTFVQIANGVSGAAGLAAGDYTTMAYTTAVSKAGEGAVEFMHARVSAGEEVWVRCLAIGENTMTLDFYLGLHEYKG